MTKRQFWQGASNWGLICGAALFVVSLIAWGGKFEMHKLGGVTEFLSFGVVFAAIFVTARQNAALCGAEGYPYSRAVGFVFAMMLFTGIVYGVGEFVLANFVARDYYDALYAARMDTAMQAYAGSALEGQMAQARDMAVRMMANPFVLIFGGVLSWLCKGGFLGLIMCAFLKRNPDPFAGMGGGESGAQGGNY